MKTDVHGIRQRKVLLSFLFITVIKLNENFLTFFKEEPEIKTTGESFGKLFTVKEIKRLGYPAFRRVFSIV